MLLQRKSPSSPSPPPNGQRCDRTGTTFSAQRASPDQGILFSGKFSRDTVRRRVIREAAARNLSKARSRNFRSIVRATSANKTCCCGPSLSGGMFPIPHAPQVSPGGTGLWRASHLICLKCARLVDESTPSFFHCPPPILHPCALPAVLRRARCIAEVSG